MSSSKQKAIELVENNLIQQIDETTFRVQGSNNKEWTVIKHDDREYEFSCNCPIWIYNRQGDRTCKHTLGVEIFIKRGSK